MVQSLFGETTLPSVDHQFLTKRLGEANLKGKDQTSDIPRDRSNGKWITAVRATGQFIA
jgi:hypothetical protein